MTELGVEHRHWHNCKADTYASGYDSEVGSQYRYENFLNSTTLMGNGAFLPRGHRAHVVIVAAPQGLIFSGTTSLELVYLLTGQPIPLLVGPHA